MGVAVNIKAANKNNKQALTETQMPTNRANAFLLVVCAWRSGSPS
jgi:hypothetical protein